jgi:glycosyltransferase involved in cell wall biosynthesis
MKVKVVESLSYGVPVVSTLRGLTGIPRHLLERFLVAASADEFAAYIHKLVKDQEFYKEQVMKSQGIFRDIFSKDKVYKELDKIFLQF